MWLCQGESVTNYARIIIDFFSYYYSRTHGVKAGIFSINSFILNMTAVAPRR